MCCSGRVGVAMPLPARQQSVVGLDNYRRTFVDPLYMNPLRITGIFTIGCLVISVGMGIPVAFLLNALQVEFRAMWMALFRIPFVMSPVGIWNLDQVWVWRKSGHVQGWSRKSCTNALNSAGFSICTAWLAPGMTPSSPFEIPFHKALTCGHR